MDSSKSESAPLFPPEQPLVITRRQALPRAGYGLQFSESLAQQIAEFVTTPLYKNLKKVYKLQAKDRTARQALNSANSVEWLSYFKGIAASTDLFFKDMEATRDAYVKANSDDKKPHDDKD